MRLRIRLTVLFALTSLFFGLTQTSALAAKFDPLPSWNEGKSKSAIVDFVKAVTEKDGKDFVPEPERIATFDNDGTLWVEQPMYTQLIFAFDRLKALAPQHPEWKDQEPYKSALAGDLKALFAGGDKYLATIMMSTHAGMSSTEFDQIVKTWFVTAEDGRFERPYTKLAYQPMLELLSYLRDNKFKTYIVTGGGIEFVRAISERVYDIPPEQVIGSSIKTKFEDDNGKPVILRLAAIDFIDDGNGKPEGIEKFIGRRPIAAFGNSDGDLEMLQWTDAGVKKHLCLYVHHTDALREYAYDRDSKVGRLDHGLDQAKQHGWTVVDMKSDWSRIFSAESDHR